MGLAPPSGPQTQCGKDTLPLSGDPHHRWEQKKSGKGEDKNWPKTLWIPKLPGTSRRTKKDKKAKTSAQREHRVEQSRSKTHVVLPDVQGMMEWLQQVFKKHNIALHAKPGYTLRQALVAPKDKLSSDENNCMRTVVRHLLNFKMWQVQLLLTINTFDNCCLWSSSEWGYHSIGCSSLVLLISHCLIKSVLLKQMLCILWIRINMPFKEWQISIIMLWGANKGFTLPESSPYWPF